LRSRNRGGGVSLVLVDVHLIVCVERHADRHIRGPKRVLVVHDEDGDASDDTHDILLKLTGRV
jgi:hypothetical protein